nr:TIGR02300 family protein [Breoghania corrubedonensis]
MAKPDLGTKQLCPSCGTKFFDLNRSPITCPKCGTIVSPAATGPRPSKASKPAKVAPVAVEDDEDLAVESAEVVSLEDADEEATTTGKTEVDIDDDEIEDIDDTDGDDDAFLPDDEDEDDDDVPGIVLEREDDE